MISENKATFFWTGSGMEFCMTGGELWLETEVPEDALPPWVCIYLNGTMMVRQQLTRGRHSFCVFSEMKQETVKKVRIRKESPAMFEETDCFFSVCTISLNGKIESIDKPLKKLEVIGDSITSGEGLGGSSLDQIWELWLSSSRPDYHYAEKLAEWLHADLRIISQSGWGVYSSYYNRTDHSLPAIYPYICGLAGSESAKKIGALKRYEDVEWNPDAVIINLGTNDAAAFDNGEWIDSKTGISYKQHINADGSYKKEDLKRLENAVYDFLVQVRAVNPDAVILWIYGMLKNQVEDSLKVGIYRYQNDKQDEKVIYIPAHDTPDAEFGSLQHPGKISHMRLAEMIKREILKWW